MKMFRMDINSRRGHHYISFHDGIQKHKDGSEFWGLHVCKNIKLRDVFIRELVSQGYTESHNHIPQKG